MFYEAPFGYVITYVKPEREKNSRPIRAKYWWRHGDSQPAMRSALKLLPRYIATPLVAKHRIFIWLPVTVLPDKQLMPLLVLMMLHLAYYTRIHEL